MDVLDIFYNHIIKEAATGRVYSSFYYNILFETYIEETNEFINCKKEYENVIVPLLSIKNKKEFDELLIKYVDLAKIFYHGISFGVEDVSKEDEEKYKVCIEKVFLTTLWGNAAFEDFQDPCNFLRKRISFLESKVVETSLDLEYSQILKGNLNLNIRKDLLETPYRMIINWENEKEEKYEFPQVKFGLQDDTVFIYAIQDHCRYLNPNIKRKLYKTGEGFDSKVDNEEIYGSGNLKDITPSFLVALNIAVSYFYSLGYSNICVPSILIGRWNAKIIMYNRMQQTIGNEEYQALVNKHENTQHNLTEKLLRTFLRLKHHYDAINIDSYPFEVDSSLHLSINGELVSNNSLLQETSDLVKNATKNKNL